MIALLRQLTWEKQWGEQLCLMLLRFNLMGVEIHGLRPEVITEGNEVLVYYRSRTNVRRRLSIETLAQVDRRTRERALIAAQGTCEDEG